MLGVAFLRARVQIALLFSMMAFMTLSTFGSSGLV